MGIVKSSSHKSSSKETKSGESKQRGGKDDKSNDLNRSLWISGLSSITKAVDLKELFTQHGKVIVAKVVTSAKSPGSQCFGFVTMSSVEEASACIEKLHKTVLHEMTIEVDKAKTDPTPSKKPPSKSTADVRKDDEKSRSSHHMSKGNNRSSRQDSRSTHRPYERKRELDKKHVEKEKEKEKDKGDSKTSSKEVKSTSKDISKEANSASKDTSKDAKSTSKESKPTKTEEKTGK